MKRALTLKREALAELTADDLAGVSGAAAATLAAGTCPVVECLGISRAYTCLDCVTRAC